MHFRMPDMGLHYYGLEDEDFLFLNTVSVNKKSHSNQQIKDDEQARELYASLV